MEAGLQKGETPRSEKVPEGEFASESGIERKPEAAALRPHGGCLRKIGRTWRKGRNEKKAVAATAESRRKRRLAHFPNSFDIRSWGSMRFAGEYGFVS